MTMHRMNRVAVVLLLCLSACVAHEKNGDKAAAVGDWKTALAAYREALMSEPESPVLKEKFERARKEAVVAASQRAHTCASMGEWQCALEEADFALSIEPANPELATFRADAARSMALDQIQRARSAAGTQQFPEAFGFLKRATALSNDPQVVQQASQARGEIIGLAGAEAERLYQLKAYANSLTLLRMLVPLDASWQPRLALVEAEYEQHLAAEYERLAGEGDAALAQRRWAEARDRYEEALRMKSGGRAESLVRYAGGMAQGESALARRDFVSSAAGYRQAVESGRDRDGSAAAQLERVEIRPYAIRLRSVLVMPTRLDGRPWVGPANPFLARLLDRGMGAVAGGDSAKAWRHLIRAAERMPAQNRPTLSVIVTTPSGERLMTPTRNSLYAVYDDPELVIATNHYDERNLVFHVVQGEGMSAEEVGVVSVALGELVQRGESELSRQSIAALELATAPASGRADGMFAGLRPLGDGTNLAQDFSMPTPRTRGFLLTGVKAVVRPGDYQDEQARDGAPDVYVELEQGGRVIYRGPVVADSYEASWSPTRVNLHVEQTEQLLVRVWDADEGDPADLVLSTSIPANNLAGGSFHFLGGPQGASVLDLRFESRRTEVPRMAGATGP
jgi:tetratricopeptide (TPR) repeat protein